MRIAAAVFVLALLSPAVQAADSVQGKLTVEGKTFALKHAYAIQLPKEPPRQLEEMSQDDIYQGNDPKKLSREERASYEEQAREQRKYELEQIEEQRKAPPGYVVVLSPKPLPAALADRIDAFSSARIAGWLDAQPELSVWLSFAEGNSTSHSIRGGAPKEPVKSFALDWNFEPTTETATQIAGKLTTEQDEKKREFFESAKIEAQATFSAAIRPVAAAGLPKTAGTASGTTEVEGQRAEMKYAYAWTVPKDALSDPGSVKLVLSEIEIPPESLDSASFYLGGKKKAGLELGLEDARPGSIQAQFIGAHNYSYSSSGGSSGVLLVENTPQAVRGQAMLSGSDKVALDVAFNARVIPADEPLELLTGKAAANSSYAKQLRECKTALAAGDLPRIRKLYRAEDAAGLTQILESAQKAEAMEFLRQVGGGRDNILSISVRKDTVGMISGSEGSRSSGTVLAKENGEWKCLFDPVSGLLDQVFGQ